MKKILFSFAILLICIPVLSQEDYTITKDTSSGQESEIKSVFGHKKPVRRDVQLGWYAGANFDYTRLVNKNAFLGGINAGCIINHFFSVGLAGYGFMNPNHLSFPVIEETNDNAYFWGGYGGVQIEFTVAPRFPFHIAFPLLIGGGAAMYSRNEMFNYDNHTYTGNWDVYDWDTYFVVQPGIRLELNLLKFMRFGIGASYRYVPDLDLIHTDKTMLDGINGEVSLLFGKF